MTNGSEVKAVGKRPKQRWRRRALWAAGFAVCLLVAAALFGPAILGAIAVSSIQSAGNRAVNGKVEVGGASLSWFGEQHVGPVNVFDAKGDRVATLRVQAERGLLSLAAAAVGLSPLDIGKFSVSGDASVVRFADGTTSLDDLFKRSSGVPGASSGGSGSGASSVELPPSLAAELNIDRWSLRLTDQATGREVRIDDLNGTAAYSKGSLTLAINGSAVSAAEGAGSPAAGEGGEGGAGAPAAAKKYVPAGVIRVDAMVRDLADSSGRITLARATAKVDVDLADVAMEIAGVLSGIGTPLVQGLGETAQISARAEGGLEQGKASFNWTSRGVRAAVNVQSEKGVISLVSPATVSASGAAIAAAASKLAPVERGQELRIDTYPSVDLTIGSMQVPVTWGVVDLRAASMTATLKTSATAMAWRAAGDGSADGGGQSGESVRNLAIGPAEVSVWSESIAKGVGVRLNAGVTLDGAPAGKLDVDLLATEVLDDQGEVRGALPVLQGKAGLAELATAVWQPIAQQWGVDLASGLGPRADVILTAKPMNGGAGTAVDVEFSSDGLRGLVRSEVEGNAVGLSGEATLRSPQSLIGSMLDSAGLDVSPGGEVTVAVRGVKFDLQRPTETATGDIEVAVKDTAVLPRGVRADPLELKRIVLAPQRRAGEPPRLSVEGIGTHDGHELAFEGKFEFPWAIASSQGQRTGRAEVPSGETKAGKTRSDNPYIPTGHLTFRAMPTSLVALWLGEETGLDRLVADAIGPSLNIELLAGLEPDRSTLVSIAAKSAQVESTIAAKVSERDLSLRSASFKGTATPEIAARVFDRVAPGSTSIPSLAGPLIISASVSPIDIPFENGMPNWSKAGAADLEIALQGDIRPPSGQSSIQATLRETSATIRFPLAAMGDDPTPRQANATFQSTLAGATKEAFAKLQGSVSLSMSGGRVSGETSGHVLVDFADTSTVDAVLGKPGFLSGGVGGSLKLSVTAGAIVSQDGATWQAANADVSVQSPYLTTLRPIRLAGDASYIALPAPVVLRWTPDPSWLNTYALAAQRAGEPIQPDSLRITESPELTVRITKLSLPMGNLPRMAPGVFDLDVQVEAPTLALAAEGREPVVVRSVAFRAIGGHEPGVLGFSLQAQDLGSGGGPGNAPALVLKGGVYQLADTEGRPTPDRAVVSMTGDVFNAPSHILDALANQDGLLAEALGPIVAVTIKTQGASQASGKLIVTMTSPRAEMELAGMITGGTFIAEGEPKVKLHTMTSDLGRMLLSGMPLIGSFEKRAEDGPAQIKVTGLRVPLDGHLERLNGDFTVELGLARFETSGVFGTLLRVAKQREAGMVGRRLQPLSLSIKDGVLTYARWKVPLGEFTFDTRGTVDLVNGRLDIVTYLPFGALTDEAAGSFNTGLGRLVTGAVPFIEQATMVPFRTRGGYADATTEPDIELFLTETGRTLLRPDRIIREGIQNILKPKEMP